MNLMSSKEVNNSLTLTESLSLTFTETLSLTLTETLSLNLTETLSLTLTEIHSSSGLMLVDLRLWLVQFGKGNVFYLRKTLTNKHCKH